VDHESTEIWKMARAFGATCHKDLSSDVTHVVTSKRGTQKVEKARLQGKVFIVWLSWFTDSVAQWKKQDERLYLLDDNRATSPSAPTASSPPSDPNAISTDTDPEELVGEGEGEVDGDGDADDGTDTVDPDGVDLELPEAEPAVNVIPPAEPLDLGGVDWQDVNDEVDAAMMESDSEDDEKSARSERTSSNTSEDGSMLDGDSNSADQTPARRRKRLRSLTPSEISNRAGSSGASDLLRSPLAKRKRLAAERSGASRLKEALSANDLHADADAKENIQEDPSLDANRAGELLDEGDDEEEDGEDEESEFGAGDDLEDDFLARELGEELDEG